MSIEGETNSNPKANFQKIHACQRLGAQQLFSEIRFTEIKADMMDDLGRARLWLSPLSAFVYSLVSLSRCGHVDTCTLSDSYLVGRSLPSFFF